MTLEREQILTWNDYRREDKQPTFGLLSQVSPDGKYLVFARAKAFHLSKLADRNKILLSEEDCPEFLKEGGTFQFDLYRIPFNDGRGGQAEPLAGASGNGTDANGAGKRWCDGATGFTHFNTILPPNGPTCVDGAWDGHPMFAPPTSYHPGGVLGAMCDGSVTFFDDSINTGNLAQAINHDITGPSPYGVWGSLGSKDGGEGVPTR